MVMAIVALGGTEEILFDSFIVLSLSVLAPSVGRICGRQA
jgi:hypothetical protein